MPTPPLFPLRRSDRITGMDAAFECTNTFGVPSHSLFVIAGRIVEGTASAGMLIDIPKADGTSFAAEIEDISMIHAQEPLLGISVEYADESERQMLNSLAIEGLILRIRGAQ